MKIYWPSKQTVDDFVEVLQDILQLAKEAAASGDASKINETRGLLEQFIKASPPSCGFLDDIALQTQHDLFLLDADQRISAIEARNVALARHTQVIGEIVKEAKQDAEALSLTKLKDFLGTAQTVVTSAMDVQKTLSNPDTALQNKLATLLADITSVADAVAKKQKS